MSKVKMSPYQQYIHKSRYARWVTDLNRRENWDETVHRYISFFSARLPKADRESITKELEDTILNMEVMPSMRAMMTAGEALDKDNCAGYNCSYIAVDDPRAFDEAMYISMCGTGVGFSVERQYVSQLPIIAENFYPTDTIIKVKDSKIGWANSFRQLIALLYGGSIPKWDTSAVRPAGSILKTFGGRASGPEPLEQLFRFTVNLFRNAAGRKLTSIECHDLMCFVADIVVSGGVRRSAMISLSNLSDDRMRNAKNGQWWIENDQRRLANNSVAYTEKPEMGIFMKEWFTLYESRSGERGIFNREGARKHVAKFGRRKWEGIDFGVNPCVSKRTIVHTAEGAKQALDLIGIPFTAVVDGEEHQSTEQGFFVTGVKPLFRISTDKGYEVEATSNHKILVVDHLSRKTLRTTWKTVADMRQGDLVVLNNHRNSSFSGTGSFEEGWLLGSLKGDGNIQKNGVANLDYWGEGRHEMVRVAVDRVHATVGGRSDLQGCNQPQYNRSRVGSVNLGELASQFGFSADKQVGLAVECSSSDFHKGFLRGWYDADGSVQGTQEKGVSVRLSSNDLQGLRAAQRMLLRLGIVSTIYPNRRDAGYHPLPNGKGGLKDYMCEAQHELVIANDNLVEFASTVGFEDTIKQSKLTGALGAYVRSLNQERFLAEVTSIEFIGEEEVLDCTIPTISAFDANGIYVHNCGEILLRPKGFCNLTEVVIRPDDTKASIKRKIRKAAILGTLQSTLTDFRYLRKEWQKNAEEERLLGVSFTGIMDNKMMSSNTPELAKMLDEFREYAVEVNKEWAEKLGINQSAAVTCIKPSGTVSQLVDSSSGIHSRFARFIERAVREDRKNPIGAFMRSVGVKCEPDVTKPNDMDVFYFPLESPADSVCRNDLTAIQQLELYLTYKLHWTEHNPSCTIYVRESEWLKVASWVYEHFDAIGGVSFLPFSDHIYKQAPYTDVTEEAYKKLVIESPSYIDWTGLPSFEKEDMTTAMKELACSAGVCELV